MDEKLWEKIYSLQENGEFEKIIKKKIKKHFALM